MKTRTPSISHKRSRASHKILKSELLDRAVELLAERGFAGTSLKDLADAVGVSRPAIYHYFPNKEAILATLLTEVTLTSARIFDEVSANVSLGRIERLREAVRRLALGVIERPLHFKMLDRCETELPPAIFEPHLKAKRRVLSGMTELVQAAIDGGEAHSIDPKIASFAVIGMCNWCAWWYRPEGSLSAETVADLIADMAVHALRRDNSRNARNNVSSLTDEIRDCLSLIERISATGAARERHPGKVT